MKNKQLQQQLQQNNQMVSIESQRHSPESTMQDSTKTILPSISSAQLPPNTSASFQATNEERLNNASNNYKVQIKQLNDTIAQQKSDLDKSVLKQQALKSRIRLIENQNTELLQKLKTLMDKSQSDDELVVLLTRTCFAVAACCEAC
jgi:chromosome segregation ATPase